MSKTKVALLGAGFIADIHVESYHRFVPDAEIVAVFARKVDRAEAFAKKHHIARCFSDLDQAIAESGCDVVDVCLPNFLHHRAVLSAARSGKHVIIEKPLALNLEEADEMIAACRGIAWFRWMLGGRPKVLSVYAHLQGGLIHEKRTRAEVNSLCIMEFEGGAIGVAENSWAKHGGMDDRVEVYGDAGVIYADLFLGNSALTYSENGYGYAMEKAGPTKGWTFTIFEEAFNQGYPQELKHFIECVPEDKEPVVTGEDGRAVLEIMNAAYHSARTGQKVSLPFHPKVRKPIDLWLA